LYVAGGRASLVGVERYDVATNKWTAVGNMLEERKWFAAVVINKPVVFVEDDFFELLINKALRLELPSPSRGTSKFSSPHNSPRRTFRPNP
jgi:hypothetical protein